MPNRVTSKAREKLIPLALSRQILERGDASFKEGILIPDPEVGRRSRVRAVYTRPDRYGRLHRDCMKRAR